MQILKAVKSDEDLYKIAFILTETSITFEQVTNRAWPRASMPSCFKPFDISLLKSKLKTVLRRRAKRQASGQ